MYSNLDTVADYLNHHEGWFVKCSSPMIAEPFGENGYTLTIGRYGSFGYEVEPKITIILAPPENNFYLMYSVDTPDFEPLGYEVDYKSTMNIEELESLTAAPNIEKQYHKHNINIIPSVITRIHWHLELKVRVQFPKFIYKLPISLIKKTGDRLLNEIVKQISPRLSYKVQKDFHDSLKIPIPPKSGRTCEIC